MVLHSYRQGCAITRSISPLQLLQKEYRIWKRIFRTRGHNCRNTNAGSRSCSRAIYPTSLDCRHLRFHRSSATTAPYDILRWKSQIRRRRKPLESPRRVKELRFPPGEGCVNTSLLPAGSRASMTCCAVKIMSPTGMPLSRRRLPMGSIAR